MSDFYEAEFRRNERMGGGVKPTSVGPEVRKPRRELLLGHSQRHTQELLLGFPIVLNNK